MSSNCLTVGVLGSCCLNKQNTPQYCEYYHGSRAQCDKWEEMNECLNLTVSQNHRHKI